MLVSIIVPNYNHASYLPKRIEAVLNQTHSAIQVIILDDKSTDDSIEVINRYAFLDDRIEIIENKKNSGSTFKQWKKGLALCAADFVWIAESDDYADATFLEKLLPLLLADKRRGLAYSNSWKVDGQGFTSVRWSEWKDATFRTTRWSTDYQNNGQDEIANYLMYDCTINNTSAVLFRKEALLQIVDQIESFRYAGDWYAFIAICLKYDIAYLAECLNYFRQHSQNVSMEAIVSGKILLERYKCMSLALANLKGYPAQKEVLLEQLAAEIKSFILLKRSSADKSVSITQAFRRMLADDARLLAKTCLRIGLGQLKKLIA